ncbi:hypothetical protein AVEN_254195-1, partial [Araneus ventricosus]
HSWGLGQRHNKELRLASLESVLWSQDALLRNALLLDGIRRTKPCSSQLPSAGVFNRMHGDKNRHFSSRAPGLLQMILYNQARTVVQTIFRWEQAGLLMTAHTVRRGSQSSNQR